MVSNYYLLSELECQVFQDARDIQQHMQSCLDSKISFLNLLNVIKEKV